MPKAKVFLVLIVWFTVGICLLLLAFIWIRVNDTTEARMDQQESDTPRYSVTTVHTETNTIKLLKDKQNGKVYQYTIPNDRLEQK